MVDLIKTLCKQKGTSIAAIEKRCGLGNGSIRKWDKAYPSVARICAVANALNVPITMLLDEDMIKPSDEIKGPNTTDIKLLLSKMTNEELWEVISQAQKYLREKS